VSVVANPVYQTAVTELEAVLSPRIVSRALKEGLRQLGRSPEAADVGDLEKVLKSQVYRQLQVMMPVTQAKETVAGILTRLEGSAAGGGQPTGAGAGGLEAQAERLATLQQELKPFNLYFEWPEVQKLRAQVQLVHDDHAAGREAPALLAEAEAQLATVKQKLEDQLVLQARDAGELQDTLELVRSLGGTRVRRLETLVNQVLAAQAQRQLAQAEKERAHRLGHELRRALEGGDDATPVAPARDLEQPEPAAPAEAPVATGEPTPELAEPAAELSAAAEPSAAAPDEVGGRVHRLEIDAELHQLRALETEFRSVLEYLPELAAHLSELRSELEAERSVAPVLSAMQGDLEATSAALRDDLRDEFEEVLASLEALRPDVDKAELEQALRVTLGILTSALPSLTDVEHVRRLHQLAKEQAEVLDRDDEAQRAGLQAQAELLARLEATLLSREGDDGLHDEVERLRSEFDQLRLAQSQMSVAHELVSSAREAEEALARSLAARATEASEKRLAQLTALRAKLERLPVTATLTDRAAALHNEVQRLIQEQENAAAVAALLLDDVTAGPPALPESELDSLGTEIETLKLELTSSLRNRLMRLAEEATELGNHPLIEHIQRALLGLELDRYPDLAQLQAALRNEREARRQEQVDELKRLSQAASPFEGYESGAELKALLADARAKIEAGEPATTLRRVAELIGVLELDADEKLASLPARLSAALEALEPVSKLNSDGVITVRRILYHLDSQRDVLPRLSRGLQLQLESALSQAERMLVELRSEYEATRLVAGQVVSGGLLDDVLGIFKTPGAAADEPTGAGPDRAAMLASYLSEDYVRAGAWTSADGTLLAGDEGAALADPGALAAAADAALPGTTATCLQANDEALVIAWPGNGELLTLHVTDPDLAGLLASRLRRELANRGSVAPSS